MSVFLSSLAVWWVHWGPWIGAALIPTIITGLSLSAKTAPEAAWVQKAWDFLKTAMGYLSVVTPKDAPGTFQLPLKLGKVFKSKSVPPALVLVLLGSSLTLGVEDGCAWTKHEASVIENNIIDCTKAEKNVIDSSPQSLIMVVLDIGSRIVEAAPSGADALSQLAVELAKEYGEPIVACVFDKMRPSATKPTLDGKDMAIVATISRRGWHFKGE